MEHQQDSLSKDQYQISLESQLIDAFELAKIFSRFESFDANKIAIGGISRGAIVTDLAARKELQEALTQNFTLNPWAFQFSCHLGIEPLLFSQEQNPILTGKPIQYIMAEKDDYTPSQPVENYAKLLQQKGYPVTYTVLKSAHHAFFDKHYPLQPKWVNTVQNFSNCSYVYNAQGWWPATEGRDASSIREWKDLGAYIKGNVTLGAHKAYNAEATEQMDQEITAFAQKHLLQ